MRWRTPAEWKALASDGVDASVHNAKGVDGNALVLEYNLNNTAGYAAATRKLPVEPSGRLRDLVLDARRSGAQQLRDEIRRCVGRQRLVVPARRTFEVSGRLAADPDQASARSSLPGGRPTIARSNRSPGIEFVVAAGKDGGKGSLWFDRLAIKPVQKPSQVAEARGDRIVTRGRATSRRACSMGRRKPRGKVMPAATIKDCCSDLQAVQEFGGLEIDWAPQPVRPALHHRAVESTARPGTRSAPSKRATAAAIRICCPSRRRATFGLTMPKPGRAVGISELHVRDLQFGASPNAFIESLAKDARRGCYPRAYSNEQTYWTILGVDGDTEESMLSEDGALEVRKGSFSIEPFVRVRDKWITWADVVDRALAGRWTICRFRAWNGNIPTCCCRRPPTASVSPERRAPRRFTPFAIQRKSRRQYTLALTVRPFQVNPPAQFLNTAGGVSPIQDLAFENGAVSVDKVASVFPRTAPQSFRAVTLVGGHAVRMARGSGGSDEDHR